jgi:hypothetical protein
MAMAMPVIAESITNTMTRMIMDVWVNQARMLPMDNSLVPGVQLNASISLAAVSSAQVRTSMIRISPQPKKMLTNVSM